MHGIYKFLTASLTALVVTGLGATARAEPTKLEVRAIAKGAKYIGTSMGGVEIVVTDAFTDAILAQGVTKGSTGDTERLMRMKLTRRASRATPGAAVFATTLDIDQPRKVRVRARGPLSQLQAAAEVSTTIWLAPGLHVTGGDALVLELPGFAVDVVSPRAHEVLKIGSPVRLVANVVMMCGCPLEPGGLWDANQMRFFVYLYRDGREVMRVPAEYAGEPNLFHAQLSIEDAGTYVARFVAFDPSDGNTGVDAVSFFVQ